MPLAPGGSYPQIRRRTHRLLRRQPNATPTVNPSSARAFQQDLHQRNPAMPYVLFGQYVTPSTGGSTSAPAGSAASPRAQRAIKSLKATNN
jgi:hypothetical protein